jgi:plastocyanin
MIRHIFTILAFALAISCASAATVSGVASLAGKGPARDVAVYLEGAEHGAPMPNAVVDQRHKMFSPHVSIVTTGTTVQFPNNDTVFHNVFAYFRAKRFDLGMYPHGASKSVTFDKDGLVVLLCNIHSDMSAFIMVVDTPYHAVTDGSGHFKITGVKPGKYKLRAWSESGAEAASDIEVTGQDATVNVELAKKP